MNAILKIESTRAKSKFAALPKQAQSRDVAITRHGRVQAYLVSPERYDHLASVDRAGEDVLVKLDRQFDALVARMQTPTHQRAVDRIAKVALRKILAAGDQSKPKRRKVAAKRIG